MLAYAETDPVLAENDDGAREAALRTELLVQQYELLAREDRAILFVVAGLDGAGKGSAVNLLNEWMDPRHIRTLAFGTPTPEELARPMMWRYWRELPARGRIGIVFGSWYQALFAQAARRARDEEALESMAAAVRRFEAMLVADHVQVVKLWFHLSRDAQRARCARLAANPDTAWRVSPDDLKVAKRFARLREAGERVIASTHAEPCPWIVVPSADDRFRAMRTGEVVLAALRTPPPAPSFAKPVKVADGRLDNLDYGDAAMKRGAYEKELMHWQARVGRAVRQARFGRRSLVLVFEGKDAAGKGGAIRRVGHALDVRQYRIVPISAPNDIERAHPYLWRFWQHAPTPGRVTIFDRSWYGRVLAERVERFASRRDWMRAYEEIDDFEAQWVAHGAILVKFWLSISDDEQLKRFREREKTAFKNFKITPDDWRNRRKGSQYRRAAADMLAHTDTPHAPWHVIATDDKRTARVQVLRTVAQALERALSTGDET
nr:polyphosphate:AMP phosphotransferase [Verticiella sediminum]